MMKKKILIGSIFALLLMVSMPFVSSIQTTPLTSGTVSKSSESSAMVTPSINSPSDAIKALITLKTLSKDPSTIEMSNQAINMISMGTFGCDYLDYMINVYYATAAMYSLFHIQFLAKICIDLAEFFKTIYEKNCGPWTPGMAAIL